MEGICRKLCKICPKYVLPFPLHRLWLLTSRTRVQLLWLQRLQGICRKLSRLRTAVPSTGKGGLKGSSRVSRSWQHWGFCDAAADGQGWNGRIWIRRRRKGSSSLAT